METNGFRAPSTRKLRLASLPPSALPGHPLLEGSGSLASLSEFVCEVLDEALAFSESAIPTTFQPKGSLKNSSPSTAKVQLLSSDVLKGEAWFARRSEHKDVPSEGTASYQEFENGLYYNHSVHEMDYTPDVFDACKVLDYQDQISQDESFRNWRAVEMEIYEMCHRIPSPLENRVFSTLVVRGKDSPFSFVVAQIPVNLSKVPAALYSTGRNRVDGETAQKREKVTIGEYVSVERVKILENQQIMWEMATASDAKGNLPMMVQKMGVPGAVVKDVGYFMKWTSERRNQSST